MKLAGEKGSLKKELQGFNGIRTRDLREYRCDALPTELLSHTLGASSCCSNHVKQNKTKTKIDERINESYFARQREASNFTIVIVSPPI